jgi:glycosyltransferase involved in cell wall biosynthesis
LILMRILHLVKKFNFGGAENHVRDLANVMVEMGNEVFIVARSGKQNELLDPRVKFISLLMMDFLILFQIPYIIYIIRKHKIALLHAHQRLPVLMAAIAGKITGIPIVVTVHGKTQYDLRAPFTREMPDRFIYVRQSTFEESSSHGVPVNKSVFIQNGVSLIETSLARNHNSVFYVSRIDKRHASVISLIIRKVVSKVSLDYPAMTFQIVGDGSSLDNLRREAEQLNKKLEREAVIIHGYVADVKEIIRDAGLVLGVGRVAIEALACGVPVLSVNYKCLGGMVSQKNYPYLRINNFVYLENPPPDDAGLITAVKEYFGNINFWSEEAAVLKDEIDRDFNIYKIGKQITDLYHEVIESKYV